MTRFVALLRSVNVGGTGKLAMADLRALGEAAGFAEVATYIASGNLLLSSDAAETEVREALETRLAVHAGRRIAVLVRAAAEMRDVVARNPFAEAPAAGVAAFFLQAPPEPGALARIRGLASDEAVAAHGREVFVRYGAAGMGRSRLRLPPAILSGTARNMNTVAALAQRAAG